MSVRQEANNHFQILIGEQLSSVSFVQDYLQLDFDGNRLTCFLWPEITVKFLTSKFDEERYRNELCKLISQVVSEVIFSDGISLKIIFNSGSEIRLSLDSKNPGIVNEIATFRDIRDNWSIF